MNRFRNTWVCLALLAGLAASGCARNYVITMQDGRRITTASKPKLSQGKYVYNDGSGQTSSVSAGRVREIAPASMVERKTEQFKPGARK